MSRIRFVLLALLVVAATCFVVASNGASAAPPTKVVVGVTYTKAGDVTPYNGNYRRVVELSLPAGKYLVVGKGSVQNQQANDDQISCNVYAVNGAQHVDASTTNVRSGQIGVLAFNGVATFAAPGVLWAECIAGYDPGALTAIRLTATTAADVIVLP